MLESTENKFNISITPSNIDDNWLNENIFLKILFGFIMLTLCLVTTIGNLRVIYQYRKASMVPVILIIIFFNI